MAPLAAAERTTRGSCAAGGSVGCRLWCGAHVVFESFREFFSRKKKFDEFFCVATSAIFADLFANLARIFLFKKKFELECVSVRECP